MLIHARRRIPFLGTPQLAAIASPPANSPVSRFKFATPRHAAPASPRPLLSTPKPIQAVTAVTWAPRGAIVPPIPRRLAPGRVLTSHGVYSLPYDLFDAVIGWLRLSPAATYAPGGFHAGWAGPNTTNPYVELEQSEDPQEYDSSASYVGTGDIIATCCGKSRITASFLADQVQSTLKDAPLFFQNGYLQYLRQHSKHWQKSTAPGPGGGVIYEDVRTFSYITSDQP